MKVSHLDHFEQSGLNIHVNNEGLGIIVGDVEYSGTIVNVETNDIVCMGPLRVQNHPPLQGELLFTVPLTEGVMVRLYYYNEKWHKATHRKIDAYAAFWTSDKSIGVLFDEVAQIDYDTLDKSCVYSYHLRHPEHRILVKIETPSVELISIRDMRTLVETAIHTDLMASHPLEQLNKLNVYRTPDGRIVRVREQSLPYQKLLKARNVCRDLSAAAGQFDQATARIFKQHFPQEADLPDTAQKRIAAVLDELYGLYLTAYNTKAYDHVPPTFYYCVKHLMSRKKFFQRHWLNNPEMINLILHAL